MAGGIEQVLMGATTTITRSNTPDHFEVTQNGNRIFVTIEIARRILDACEVLAENEGD